MSGFDYFLYLASGTAEWLLSYFGLATIPLFLGTVYLVGSALNRKEANPLRVLVACIAPAIIPIGVLIVGVAFVRPEEIGWEAVPWFTGLSRQYAETAVSVLMVLILPFGLAVGWWARRAWIAILASTIWWSWVSISAAIMANMSITGNWL
jgi:cadmium resistance protein CadD (predicted permease)